jgi:Sap-like sulfolipid-1-addressing protein
VFEQAAGLAALAAISPSALLIAAVYLGSTRPRKMTALFLTGAVLMSIILAIVILVALRAGSLSLPSRRQPRYGLRVGLGAVALAACGFVVWRWRGRRKAPPDPAAPKKEGLITRLARSPRPLTAIATGVLIFGPSVGLIAAIQVIATSKASIEATTAALALVVVIYVACAWVPLVVHLIAPDRTTRALAATNAWIRARGQVLLAGALGTIGVILLIDGALGLA